MKFHSWGPRVNSSSDSITISKMILLLDEFLAISAVTKYFSWGEGRRPSLPVYSQFTTPRWKRWHEFTVQFSILFLLPPPPFPLCSSFAAIPSSLSIIYYFETSKILFHFVAPEKFLGRSRDSRFLLFINGTNRRIFCALWRNMTGGNTMNIQSIDWEIIRGINPLIFDRLEDVFALKVIS